MLVYYLDKGQEEPDHIYIYTPGVMTFSRGHVYEQIKAGDYTLIDIFRPWLSELKIISVNNII